MEMLGVKPKRKKVIGEADQRISVRDGKSDLVNVAICGFNQSDSLPEEWHRCQMKAWIIHVKSARKH